MGEQLEFWAGRDCAGVASVTVLMGPADGPEREWVMTAEQGTGSVESFVVGEAPAGFVAPGAAPEPAADDTITVVVRGEDDLAFSRTSWQLTDVTAGEGAQEGEWLTPSGEWVSESDASALAEDGIRAPLCASGDSG
ncbi:hypothetical protein [Serinicoccus profundi]|uniref:hypothetical protein n=1 Tax=Serinicoccus profundi TaxID=1078471 RepID=UPI000255E852|nr:hypothetical protein [Serinicoccus profundi]